MIVANEVGVDGQGLASDFNAVTIVTPSGVVAEVPRLSKTEVAGRIWGAIDAGRTRVAGGDPAELAYLRRCARRKPDAGIRRRRPRAGEHAARSEAAVQR